MNKKIYLGLIGILPAIGMAKSNVLFFLVDDLGGRDLSCYGSTFHESPNIDALANSGMRFTQAYSSCPVCSPTRAAIMTGKYPARVGITDWIPGMNVKNPEQRRVYATEDLHNLPYEEITIAEAFKAAGYTTFYAGKWHLGETEEYWPEFHGFDYNKGGTDRGSPNKGYHVPYDNARLPDGPKGENLTDRLGMETLKFLDEHHDEPFFAVLSFHAVHTPLDAHRDYIAHFEAKAAALPPDPGIEEDRLGPHGRSRQDDPVYGSMIYAVDAVVGRIMNKLDELGISDNTIVVFTSDNGGHPRGTTNWPLRSIKGWCYEGGIRIPMIVRAPGVTKPGSISDIVTTSTDHYPTLLELAGLKSMPDQHKDGRSLVPALKGGSLDREAVYWHYPHFHGSDWAPGAALRSGKWKLIEFYELNKVELFDLESDPSEQKDLSKVYPEKTAALLDQLHQWQVSVDAKMPVLNPAFKN